MVRARGMTIAILALLNLMTVGCGSDEGAAAGAGGEVLASSPSEDAAPAAAPESAPAASAPAGAPGAAPVGKPAPKLTSLPSTPVPAADLRDAYFHWKGVEVTVAGYPSTFFDKSEWSGVSNLTAAPEKGAQELVDCSITNPPDGKVARTTPVVLRGTFRAMSWATAGNVPVLQMDDCQVVEDADPSTADGDPWQLDGTPIPIQAFYDAALGWQGRRVQVVGRYDSSTHSSAGDTQRHDIDDASGKDAVACSHPGSAPAPRSAVDDRDGVIVEGTVGEPFFGQVHLTDCRFVNRS